MFPLLALPYMAAGIGALGTGARVAGSPQGQRFMQGGINTLSKYGNRLIDFLNPVGQPTYQTFFGPGNKALKIGGGIVAGEPFEDAIMDAGSSVSELIEKLIKKEEKDKDKKDKKKKKTKQNKIPEVALKKGGMVKPKKTKKKKKKYKSSTFVKMKGSKRYI